MDLKLLLYRMDSYVLAETFKYLYLMFSEKSDLLLDIDDYIFTTEAHLLPLTLSLTNSSARLAKVCHRVLLLRVFPNLYFRIEKTLIGCKIGAWYSSMLNTVLHKRTVFVKAID